MSHSEQFWPHFADHHFKFGAQSALKVPGCHMILGDGWITSVQFLSSQDAVKLKDTDVYSYIWQFLPSK